MTTIPNPGVSENSDVAAIHSPDGKKDRSHATVATPKRRQLPSAVTIIALAYLFLVLLISVFAPILWPHVLTQQAGNILDSNQAPSVAHILGTDTVGRDVLLRILVGTRATMIGVLEGLFFALLFGIPIGIAAGYFGGWLDKLVSWLADIAFSIPAILIIIIVLAIFPANMTAAMFTFGVLAAPGLMRLVRSVTMQVREELFIQAATVAGLGSFYILSRHVLSRIRGALAVQASFLAAGALLVQTGLAFLGLLITPPQPSWGGMVADGTNVLAQNSWLIWPPGIVIALTVLAFGIVGDSIQTRSGAPTTRVKVPRSVRVERVSRAGQTTQDTGSIPAAEELLSVHDLRVTAVLPGGNVSIVDSVSLTVNRREMIGLVGESGCGKSITSSAILGLLPPNLFISDGRVIFEGVDLVQQTQKELRAIRGNGIGFIGQEPMISLNPTMRVGTQLAELVRLHRGSTKTQARAHVRDLLLSVRLTDPEAIMSAYPHELSGGMAQRVAIARALAGDPVLLIADEPTTALDVTVQAEILDLLRELQKRNNMSVILITHDWGVVADICDRAYVMYAGEVVEERTITNIFAKPAHPYTSLLLNSDPHRSRGVTTLPTIPGQVPPPGTWETGCRFADRCPFVQKDCRSNTISLVPLDGEGHVRCVHALQGVVQ